MVKVIIGYKLKQGADIQPILLRLRSYAVTFPGFVGAENLRSERDPAIVVMQSNWLELKDWKTWESSKIRQQILKDAQSLLEDEPRVTVYMIMPTSGWVYTKLKV